MVWSHAVIMFCEYCPLFGAEIMLTSFWRLFVSAPSVSYLPSNKDQLCWTGWAGWILPWTGRHRQPVKCWRHIWTGQYLIFRKMLFLLNFVTFFELGYKIEYIYIYIFGCSAVHTFKSALTNRSVTLHETVYSATELCLKFSSFHSSRFI